MASSLAILGTVLLVSSLEATWVWLLNAAVSEVSEQIAPSPVFIAAILASSWLMARLLASAGISLHRRRLLLMIVGLSTTLAAGTVHAGLVNPLQLVFGQYSPDYRGAGITLSITTAYLFARGLALSTRVTRDRVIQHSTVTVSALTAILILMPLVDVVRSSGLSVVLTAFLLAGAALLLTQMVGAESRQVSALQWAGIGIGITSSLVICASIITGAFSPVVLDAFGFGMTRIGQITMPVTNTILVIVGYGAEMLAMTFRWLGTVFGVDAEAIIRSVRNAEQSRPNLDDQPLTSAPEILSLIVAVGTTAALLFIAAIVFYRLTRNRRLGGDADITEWRSGLAPGNIRNTLGALWDGIRRLRPGDEATDRDSREQIRRHYRAFQLMLAQGGLPRHHDQTPTEYERTLAVELPTSTVPVAKITAAYIVARYGDEFAAQADPSVIGTALSELRQTIRSRT